MSNSPPLLPLFFKLERQPCLVIGAGFVGLQKIQGLLECGADVTVIAQYAVEQIQQLAAESRIRLLLRSYLPGNLESFRLVIAATSDTALNHQIFEEASKASIFCNVVDDPDFCDFYFGSIVRNGALQIAISTAGESPAFAQRLKEEIAAAIPSDTGEWLAERGDLRRQINRALPSDPQRVQLLRELARRESCDPDTCPCRTLIEAAR